MASRFENIVPEIIIKATDFNQTSVQDDTKYI